MKLFKSIFLSLIILIIAANGYCNDSLMIDANGNVGIGTDTPQKKLHVNGDVQVSGDVCTDNGYCLNSLSIPTGGIILWSGSIATIPPGWALCDGTNGTPNLTDRFVIHADADSGGTNNVGETGNGSGSTANHTLTVDEIPSHRHNAPVDSTILGSNRDQNAYSNRGGNSSGDSVWRTQETGGGQGHNHTISAYKPKYYALAYIMKL